MMVLMNNTVNHRRVEITEAKVDLMLSNRLPGATRLPKVFKTGEAGSVADLRSFCCMDGNIAWAAARTARLTFNRPLLTTLPAKLGAVSVLDRRETLIWLGVKSGRTDLINAAAPETWAAAILVPER